MAQRGEKSWKIIARSLCVHISSWHVTMSKKTRVPRAAPFFVMCVFVSILVSIASLSRKASGNKSLSNVSQQQQHRNTRLHMSVTISITKLHNPTSSLIATSLSSFLSLDPFLTSTFL